MCQTSVAIAAIAVPMKNVATPTKSTCRPPYLSVAIPMNGDNMALMMAEMP